jgi:plasmid stabilization system protein ParE
VRVVWAPSALEEIVENYGYIAADNPAAARRIADALLKAGDSLETFRAGAVQSETICASLSSCTRTSFVTRPTETP